MKKQLLTATFVAATILAGCSDKKTPTQKEVAVKQWNDARAAVLGSLAKSQYESGDFDKSQQTVMQALTLAPQNPQLHILAARLRIEQGQLEDAEKELNLARQFDPKSAEIEYYTGVVYQRWQKFEQAYEYYSKAADKDKTELAYVLARAEMLVAMNRSTDALKSLQFALNDFEHNPTLFQAIGQLQVDQGNYTDAVESLQQASVLATDDLTIREHLAMAYFYNHQYVQATDLFSRLVKEEANAKRSELWVALGQCQLETGKAHDARESFETATEVNAASTDAWLCLAKAALQLGDTRRADIVLRKVMSLNSDLSEAHLMLGYIRLKEKRMPEALSEFQAASALDRSDPVSVCMVGYVMEKTGKPDQAIKFYAQALKIKPNDKLATSLMASVSE